MKELLDLLLLLPLLSCLFAFLPLLEKENFSEFITKKSKLVFPLYKVGNAHLHLHQI